jgi:PleD family two-component response regulator
MEWVIDEVRAVEICKQRPVSVVMINTSTPGVDPYRLCRAVKEKNSRIKIVVIFLIGKPAEYDLERANHVGADGFLIKPLASQHLVSALKKFLPQIR